MAGARTTLVTTTGSARGSGASTALPGLAGTPVWLPALPYP